VGVTLKLHSCHDFLPYEDTHIFSRFFLLPNSHFWGKALKKSPSTNIKIEEIKKCDFF